MIVEDGTGVVDANSYLTEAEASDILAEIGFTGNPSEQDLIQASYYLDSKFTPSSRLLNKDQGLLFPRQPFTDYQGREVEGIPKLVKRVVALIAVAEQELFNPSPAIRQQSFGDTSVSYAGPFSEDQKIDSYIAVLATAGYGSNSANTINIIRA